MSAWRKLPVWIRAPLVAFGVLYVGTFLGTLPLLANLKFLPAVPWALPATLLLMAPFWLYFTGRWYPQATRAMRQDVTRRKQLSAAVWRAAILPLLIALITTTSLRLALPSVLPIEAPRLSVDLSAYPLTTSLGLLLSLAISAGITEEVAFRGYLQKPLEDRLGIVPALLLTGIAFWYAHSDKVALSHLPFHMVASILLGLCAYLTRSLLPVIAAHAVGDALLLPAYLLQKPAFVWDALTARPVWEGSAAVNFTDRAALVWTAMNPTVLVRDAYSHPFAVWAWIFIAGAALVPFAFVQLARTAREAYR